MCFGAVGSQTGGSITRPASFCGVAGFKPTPLYTVTTGVFPFAPNLDHVGPIARAVDDLRTMFVGMGEDIMDLKMKRNKPTNVSFPPRLGRLNGFFERRAGQSMNIAFEDAIRTLAAAGAEIVALEGPVDFDQILINHRMVMAAEAAHTHSQWIEDAPDDYPPRITELVAEGGSLRARDYLAAEAGMSRAQMAVFDTFFEHKVYALITPATISTAPDRTTTGDPAFNSPWSYTHLPTVSFPVGRASDGLPVALQLVGWDIMDFTLLDVAEWCEQAIRSSHQ
jgi:aspartyl-tRNA(Asn)/glutamyl-tRNA(Gln) amidotransferase subunit A